MPLGKTVRKNPECAPSNLYIASERPWRRWSAARENITNLRTYIHSRYTCPFVSCPPCPFPVIRPSPSFFSIVQYLFDGQGPRYSSGSTYPRPWWWYANPFSRPTLHLSLPPPPCHGKVDIRLDRFAKTPVTDGGTGVSFSIAPTPPVRHS